MFLTNSQQAVVGAAATRSAQEPRCDAVATQRGRTGRNSAASSPRPQSRESGAEVLRDILNVAQIHASPNGMTAHIPAQAHGCCAGVGNVTGRIRAQVEVICEAIGPEECAAGKLAAGDSHRRHSPL